MLIQFSSTRLGSSRSFPYPFIISEILLICKSIQMVAWLLDTTGLPKVRSKEAIISIVLKPVQLRKIPSEFDQPRPFQGNSHNYCEYEELCVPAPKYQGRAEEKWWYFHRYLLILKRFCLCTKSCQSLLDLVDFKCMKIFRHILHGTWSKRL